MKVVGGPEDHEGHAALEVVAREVMGRDMDDDAAGASDVPGALGLPTFDEVAVVDHVDEDPRVVAASGPLVEAAVGLEARLRQGPSTEAVASGELVVCRDLEHERRWPQFVAAALAGPLGLRRWAVVPLAVPGERPLGAIVLVAADPGIVTPGDLSVVGGLADRSALHLTARVAAGREARAVVALDTVRVVGLAVGVTMATEGLTEQEALRALTIRSRATGTRLADAAVLLLTEQGMSFR